ncbi:50S ribosomal protein L25 [Paenibacillus aurantius]|uniref:Large ribosomal subunit protein bL25 n=1 Tax=Paenibacillus aurantius TaxID=2918900 RepID=A0AA96LHS2_9BACL|nr:50S ribosomal protein L25 [Paenibacillus aurantius]WJH36366.1 50S ribosomal protein L25 [Paenibacillus sp. CC-CFT747]WNQ11672.1 50S ribosomal protein L25 [Paenibacillus aurantius]
MSTSLKAEVRKGTRRSETNKLRAEGYIPGSVYGKNVGTATISILGKDLTAVLRSNPHAVLELDIASVGKHPVMINELQKDKVSGQVTHVDFHQINMNEPVKSMVAIEQTGESAGVKAGGVLQTILHEVEVKGLPEALPASLPIDISNLEVGENLLVSDLTLPDGLELLTEPTSVIVSVLAPTKAVEEEEEAGEAAAETNADEAAEESNEEKAE